MISSTGASGGVFSPERIKELQVTFSLFDHQGRGVTVSDLGVLLRSQGINPSEMEMQEVLRSSDPTCTGLIGFDAFLAILGRKTISLEAESAAEIAQAFRVFDANADGFITFDELKQVLHSLGDSLSDEEMLAMIAVADTSGTGRVDFEAFRQMMLRGERSTQ